MDTIKYLLLLHLATNNLKYYGRRHFKLFTNYHVSWDTLYLLYNECRANYKVKNDYEVIIKFILSRAILKINVTPPHAKFTPPPPKVNVYLLNLPPFQWRRGGEFFKVYFPELRTDGRSFPNDIKIFETFEIPQKLNLDNFK